MFFFYSVVCVYIQTHLKKKNFELSEAGGEKAVFLIQSFCPFLLNNPLAFFKKISISIFQCLLKKGGKRQRKGINRKRKAFKVHESL